MELNHQLLDNQELAKGESKAQQILSDKTTKDEKDLRKEAEEEKEDKEKEDKEKEDKEKEDKEKEE